jgi:hypothetical protein
LFSHYAVLYIVSVMSYQYRAAVSASKMFHEIRANRAADRAKYGVFSVKKNGERYAKPAVVESTLEYAEGRADSMRKLNPGHSFVVEAL